MDDGGSASLSSVPRARTAFTLPLRAATHHSAHAAAAMPSGVTAPSTSEAAAESSSPSPESRAQRAVRAATRASRPRRGGLTAAIRVAR